MMLLFNIFCLLLNLKCLKHCLVHRAQSVDICRINESIGFITLTFIFIEGLGVCFSVEVEKHELKPAEANEEI